MEKISYSEYLAKLRDADTTDDEIKEFSIIARGDRPFDIRLKPDPDKVRLTLEDIEEENAMQTANGLARLRRRIRFKRKLAFGSKKPVLVSEGDSWFQFPVLVREIVDHLGDDYLIWSVGAAGDTAENMVYGALGHGRTEYMRALQEQRDRVQGFLFSAAGNDVIGEDPKTNRPVLEAILKKFDPAKSEKEHINQKHFDKTLKFLRGAYQKVIDDVRAVPDFETLPIFIHAYDYVFPYPYPSEKEDKRNPLHADKDEWIGKPMTKRGIMDPDFRREIIKILIDQTYDMLEGVAKKNKHVVLVDCRGTLTEVEDWIDEIHGTTDGFEKIAEKFRAAISKHV